MDQETSNGDEAYNATGTVTTATLSEVLTKAVTLQQSFGFATAVIDFGKEQTVRKYIEELNVEVTIKKQCSISCDIEPSDSGFIQAYTNGDLTIPSDEYFAIEKF